MSLQNILRERRKHKAILDYLERLGPALARMYGKSDLYSPQEILSAITEKAMSRDDCRYALALYSAREDFDTYCAANNLDDNYFEIRIEIADLHFGGNAGFMPIDVEFVHDHLVRHRNPEGSEAAEYFYASDQGADYYRRHSHDGGDQRNSRAPLKTMAKPVSRWVEHFSDRQESPSDRAYPQSGS